MVPWPFVHVPLRLNLFLSDLHTIFYCLHVCLILLYVLVGVYLLWHEGCVGFWAYVPCLLSLLWIGRYLGKGPHLLAKLICVSGPFGY